MQTRAGLGCFRRSFQHSNSTPQFSPRLCAVEYWKFAIAAVSFLQVCLLFQWLSSGAQNRPLSLSPPLHLSMPLIFPLSTDWISNLPICIWNWVESKISRGALSKSSYTHMYTQTCLSLLLAPLFTKFNCTERLSGVFELATRSELCCMMNITAVN